MAICNRNSVGFLRTVKQASAILDSLRGSSVTKRTRSRETLANTSRSVSSKAQDGWSRARPSTFASAPPNSLKYRTEHRRTFIKICFQSKYHAPLPARHSQSERFASGENQPRFDFLQAQQRLSGIARGLHHSGVSRCFPVSLSQVFGLLAISRRCLTQQSRHLSTSFGTRETRILWKGRVLVTWERTCNVLEVTATRPLNRVVSCAGLQARTQASRKPCSV